MTFGTKDGIVLTCCSKTVINKNMTGDGSVDTGNPDTGVDNKLTVGPTDPTGNANEGDYYINDTTGEIWEYENGVWVDTGLNIFTYINDNSGNNDDNGSGDDSTTFMDAPTARLDATQQQIIDNEISAIEKAITGAVDNHAFSITVQGTYMTDISTGQPYFRVWKDLDPCCPLGYDTRSIVYQMDQVISYFFNLKYVVERKQPTTSNNFVWYVYW